MHGLLQSATATSVFTQTTKNACYLGKYDNVQRKRQLHRHT
jgi:hypothetical protein